MTVYRRKYPPRFRQREPMDWGNAALAAVAVTLAALLILIVLLALGAFK